MRYSQHETLWTGTSRASPSERDVTSTVASVKDYVKRKSIGCRGYQLHPAPAQATDNTLR